MKKYSLYHIVLLCIAILIVDIFAFYWLQSITRLLHPPYLRKWINIIFWIFTSGLIIAILVLKIRMDHISQHRRYLLISSLYGLTVSSFIPKLIFVLVISVLYFTNFIITDQQSLLLVPLAGLVAGLLPFFVIVYAIFRSLYRFKVYHVKVNHRCLPSAFDGVRIIHISDTHLGSFNSRFHIFDRAVSIINHLEPDYIFFTGDLVNNYAYELQGWEETFTKMKARRGKFAVPGNHDYGDYSEWPSETAKTANFSAIKEFYERIGFRLLLNDSFITRNGVDYMAIIGVENWGMPPGPNYCDLKKAVSGVIDVPFKILLSHDPRHWPKEVVGDTDIALTLSGHTHGMQAAITLRNKSWSPIQYKYEHWAGLYQEAEQYLYVNRGLGWLGFPGRLGMRPEITMITLTIKQ
ncbi:MAG TPA: metallophosphoesterase [Chitinophagaceae bacterium]|nr:metallophosphoesterase [Chitinophagaceae bacterium]